MKKPQAPSLPSRTAVLQQASALDKHCRKMVEVVAEGLNAIYQERYDLCVQYSKNRGHEVMANNGTALLQLFNSYTKPFPVSTNLVEAGVYPEEGGYGHSVTYMLGVHLMEGWLPGFKAQLKKAGPPIGRKDGALTEGEQKILNGYVVIDPLIEKLNQYLPPLVKAVDILSNRKVAEERRHKEAAQEGIRQAAERRLTQRVQSARAALIAG